MQFPFPSLWSFGCMWWVNKDFEVRLELFPCTAATVTYDKDAETVTLEFSSELSVGEVVISLSYTGCLNDQMRGFYRSKYTVDGEERYAAVTQFEVCHLMPTLP